MEVMLPLPSDLNKRREISNYIEEIIKDKVKLRKKISKLKVEPLNFFFNTSNKN